MRRMIHHLERTPHRHRLQVYAALGCSESFSTVEVILPKWRESKVRERKSAESSSAGVKEKTTKVKSDVLFYSSF
jgi:hypothetical protein